MANMITSHAQIIKQWPRSQDFAADIGVHDDSARQWVHRDRIPAKYWVAIVQAAKVRGYPVSLELLAHLAAKAA